MIGLAVLLFTPVDTLSVGTLIRSPSAVSAFIWMNTIVPVILLVGVVLIMLVLFNAARVNNFDDLGKDFEQSRSRRGFLGWLKKVASGASLAVIGLSLANPRTVLAESDCTPCTGCSSSCTYDKNRCGDTYPWLLSWVFYSGCTPPGCTTTPGSCCVYQCNCDPCSVKCC